MSLAMVRDFQKKIERWAAEQLSPPYHRSAIHIERKSLSQIVLDMQAEMAWHPYKAGVEGTPLEGTDYLTTTARGIRQVMRLVMHDETGQPAWMDVQSGDYEGTLDPVIYYAKIQPDPLVKK